MAVKQIGPRVYQNTVRLSYVTAADDIQAITVWPAGGPAIEDGSTATEVSADGLTEMSLREFINGKWALVATL